MTASFPAAIKTFSDLVDGFDDVLASHQNEVRAEVTAVETFLQLLSIYGAYANTEVLSGNKTLTDADKALQYLDPGAARDVILPAEAVTNHLFIICNTADAAETITVKNDAAGTIGTVAQGENKTFISNGVTWKVLTVGAAGAGGSITVREADSSPSVSTETLVLPNGSLTDSGGGVATVNFTAGVTAATDAAAGKVELATDAETQTGTDTARAVTPAGLQSKVASATAKGIVELATNAETQTGTDDTRAVTPASLQSKVASATAKGIVELADVTETGTGTDDTRAVSPKALKDAGFVAVDLIDGVPHKQLWIGNIKPTLTNGCGAAAQLETATNKRVWDYWPFDASAIEYGYAKAPMPQDYTGGVVYAKFYWTHPAATAFKVSWRLAGASFSDDDALEAAVGTAITSNDDGGTTHDLYISPLTAAITISGTPAAGDMVWWQISRKADDATNDTLDVDAWFMGVMIWYPVG